MTPPDNQSGQRFYRRLALHAGLDFVTLDPSTDDPTILRAVNPLAAALLPPDVCRRFTMLPISMTDGVVTIVTSEPLDVVGRELAGSILKRPVVFAVAMHSEVVAAMERAFQTPIELDETGRPRLVEDIDPDAPKRIGEMLVESGAIDEQMLQDALDEQDETGSRVGEILIHSEQLDPAHLADILAEQHDLPRIDLTGLEPDYEALAVIPEPVKRRLRCVPFAISGRYLDVVVADAPSAELLREVRLHTTLELRPHLAPANDIDVLMQRIYGAAYAEAARSELLNRFPEDCANRVLTGAQKVFGASLLIVMVLALVIAPIPTLIVLVSLSSALYLSASIYKFKLTYNSLSHQYEIDVTDEEIAALDDRELPIYTILVPLYREAAVLPALVQGIGELDYPATKLDVRLLCEEDDEETVDAIIAMNLPPHFKLVVVPDAQPKTKPKACNYGLIQADGEFVVIYDAEDRPDRDQLKKVIVAFSKSDPTVTCIQAKLNYFNSEQNLLTRWFTTEYSMWFDLLLPGLDSTGSPIPLGGTSNHFVTERLVGLAAWDPFNVTEDADLGIRLHKAGYRTAMVDSTTLEEANSEVGNWIRQRSRWIKGYLQTYFVHMRHPVRLFRQLGLKHFISFQLVVGGTFIFLLNPIYWALTTVFFFTGLDVIQDIFPSFVFYAAALQLFVGNFIFMYLNVAGSIQRGYYGLAKYALLTPLYWGLMSIAAWKGAMQLITNPFYWEKTEHGLSGVHEIPTAERPAAEAVA